MLKNNYIYSIFFNLSLLFLPVVASAQTIGELNKAAESAWEKSNQATPEYAGNSVLASGDWCRIAVSSTGIHKLSFSDLNSMGIPVNGLSSSSIRVHGYGGRMIPERNSDIRYDDLPEMAIYVSDGGDGTFDQGDYILFYGVEPTEWIYNTQTGIFNHKKHLYTEKTYYFISVRPGAGKRIEVFPQPQSAASTVVNTFDWRYVYHTDQYNLIKSGKEWFGDIFDVVTSRNYSIPSVSPAANANASIRLSVAARSVNSSSFTLSAFGKTFNAWVSPIIIEPNTAYARMATETYTTEVSARPETFNLKFVKASGASVGWLNFFEINMPAELRFDGGLMNFRKFRLSGVAEFNISGTGNVAQLWDVTDPLNPGKIIPESNGSGLKFKALSDQIREYTLGDEGSFLKPEFVEKVVNQNLHGTPSHTMVIITHPLFSEEANRLAEFHAQHDNFSVLVVQPQAIYNEFSSGAQDISAIRDFMRMLYTKADEWNKPRFLLLFGDASFDFKDIIPGNSNFIPTFQSVESLHPVSSYATDDFFGSFDSAEGGLSTDVVDIGIGRFVVQTTEEAKNAVDKIIHYVTAKEKVHGDWRNYIVFVADDEDGNDHMRQADELATMIDTTYKNYITDKIFLDAYPQISTPGGQRIPEANKAINQRMEKGALIVNYTGHGGETGWSLERVLENNDVNSWTNYNSLPVFMTATCEFSRYDDPLRVSGGELVFLNPKGGGVALFTTSRPTFGTPNFTLARNFYNLALKPDDNGMPYLGDLIRESKKLSGSDNNGKKFILLGNPAMKMAYPEHRVFTTSINGQEIEAIPDTLKAMSEVTISGYVGTTDGLLLSDFQGVLTSLIFDKESVVKTLGTDGTTPMTFGLRRNIIYKGKAVVKDGHFSFSFIVPRDIIYQYGLGKISYYATNGDADASGSFDNLIVGGFSKNAITDNEGPEIRLFINDTLFKSGGYTDENPVLLAHIKDESGINTIGTSIGHDIVAVLDGKTELPYVLNEFYEADLGTYKSGRISFPFKNLSPGKHTLKLKLWDVNNNSSEASIDFVVSSSSGLVLGGFEVFPNPVSESAVFLFEHNKAGETLDLTLDIFSLSGVRAATLNRSIFADGYRTPAFEWNGRGGNGSPLAAGFYIGRLRVKDKYGNEAVSSVKISLIK